MGPWGRNGWKRVRWNIENGGKPSPRSCQLGSSIRMYGVVQTVGPTRSSCLVGTDLYVLALAAAYGAGTEHTILRLQSPCRLAVFNPGGSPSNVNGLRFSWGFFSRQPHTRWPGLVRFVFRTSTESTYVHSQVPICLH